MQKTGIWNALVKKKEKEIMHNIHKIYFCLFDGTTIGQSQNNQI